VVLYLGTETGSPVPFSKMVWSIGIDILYTFDVNFMKTNNKEELGTTLM